MTVDELSQIYYINKEIRSLQLELAQLRQKNFYKSNTLSDMPGKGESADQATEYINDVMILEGLLQYNLSKLQKEKQKAEEFIENVSDAQTRLIIRLRVVNNMKWEDIGKELGYERTTVSKKFYEYFKDSHKSH
jgi:hypothetical protein